ncbi:MAG: M14 family zinc carboxypeptidase [Actinomycetota bacterium]
MARTRRNGRRGVVGVACLALAVTASAEGPAVAAPPVQERHVLGESVEGRPIRVAHEGDPEEPVILVVGCIHGDECAGVGIARRLLAGGPRHFVDLWVLPNLNPDGRAAGTRQNARGVDLNRNFPFRWEPGPPGRYDPGHRPLSEPESRIAARLVRRIEPDVSIWFHQPLALVDRSGGDAALQRRYARAVGLRLVQLGRLHGTATSWQNHTYRGTTAFVVELPPGPLRPRRARVFARAVFDLARWLR